MLFNRLCEVIKSIVYATYTYVYVYYVWAMVWKIFQLIFLLEQITLNIKIFESRDELLDLEKIDKGKIKSCCKAGAGIFSYAAI